METSPNHTVRSELKKGLKLDKLTITILGSQKTIGIISLYPTIKEILKIYNSVQLHHFVQNDEEIDVTVDQAIELAVILKKSGIGFELHGLSEGYFDAENNKKQFEEEIKIANKWYNNLSEKEKSYVDILKQGMIAGG